MTCRASASLARHEHRLGDGHAGELHDVLGPLLVHGERRRKNARMRVGNRKHFEDALHAAVLAEAAVQRVEAHIRIDRRELTCEISIDVDLGDAIAVLTQRLPDRRAGVETDIALRR